MLVNYDDIACKYDDLIEQDIKKVSFPYAGYQLIQDLITDDLLSQKKKSKVLDIGCGTGKLYEKMNPSSFHLTGLDASLKMLNEAKCKYPKATFIHYDILRGLPKNLYGHKYDYIIVNYVFMHYPFNTTIDLIHVLLNYLDKGGKIIIAGLQFINQSSKQEFFINHQDYKDLNLYFHIYSRYVNQVNQQLALSFFEINDYTGMMIIENINDFTLHLEDPLVKYKSNTVKWRSTHPQRCRE